jgi:REP element-mobilizing transposase RayT
MKITSPHNKVYLFVHVVWCVKHREHLLTRKTLNELLRHINQAAEEKGIKILIVNGVEDHVHCLIQMHPLQNLSGLIKQIKGESSRWLNENKFIAGSFEWQDGYAAFTVSPNLVKNMIYYIYNQEKHHLDQNYSDELKSLEK